MILVTGGLGFIGSHTVVELQEQGFEVVIVDNLVNAKMEVLDHIETITGKRPFFVKADVCDEAAMEAVFAEYPIDAVIHFAGLKAVAESIEKPLIYYTNNLVSTLTLLRVMKAHGCRRLVFSSSATVYGPVEGGCCLESMKTGETTNPYGTTKVMQERILTDVAAADPGLSVAFLRYFNPIGAHKSGLIGDDPNGIPNNLMPYICGVAAGTLPCLQIFGDDYDTPDGTCIRDYIHVVDLAKGHIAALAYLKEHTGILTVNLGRGCGVSVKELVTAFENACGIHLASRVVGRRPGDLPVCYADTHKAEKLLGWKAEKTIEEMCLDSYRFALAHR